MKQGNECIKALDRAVALIQDMKGLLAEGESDAPAGFLEASHEVIYALNQAVALALVPLLEGADPDETL